MRIDVTQKHIDDAVSEHERNGNINCANRCIIANAISCSLKTDKIFCAITRVVADNKMYVLPKEAVEVTNLPSSMWDTVKPFSFELEVPNA